MSKKSMGITEKNKLRRKRNERIVALRFRGHSYGEIADIMEVDKATAYRVCRFGQNSWRPVSVA